MTSKSAIKSHGLEHISIPLRMKIHLRRCVALSYCLSFMSSRPVFMLIARWRVSKGIHSRAGIISA